MKSIFKSIFVSALICAVSAPVYAGLDIYAGPLTTFYKHDYLSTQAQFAKDMGIEFNTVYPEGEPKWLTERNAPKKIRAFRKSIEDANLNIGEWTEDGDAYLIEQLHWDGLAAVIYVAAYAIREDLERPKTYIGHYAEDPAYTESFDKEYYFGPLAVLESDLFIPSESSSVIFEDDPLKSEIMITTTGNLRKTLEFLNQRVWNGAAEPEAWFDRGLAKTGAVDEFYQDEKTGKIEMKTVEYPRIDDEILYNAEFAYGVLMKFLKYSEKNNVPIAMDG